MSHDAAGSSPAGASRPAGAADPPAGAAGLPLGTAAPGVSWRWMGSDQPLFLRVADQIERYVAGNGLSPGDRLPGERDLGELLGVSRASVREALRSLQARGLVGVRHGKGVFVAAPTGGEGAMERFARLREVGLEELFAMREVLEVPAAGWAATAATDEQLQQLVATFEELEQAVLTGSSARELQAMDAQLHLQIADFASNRFLAMTQTVLQEMLARDANRARAAARRHIHSARRAALSRVASERARTAPPLTAGRAVPPASPSGGSR